MPFIDQREAKRRLIAALAHGHRLDSVRGIAFATASGPSPTPPPR